MSNCLSRQSRVWFWLMEKSCYNQVPPLVSFHCSLIMPLDDHTTWFNWGVLMYHFQLLQKFQCPSPFSTLVIGELDEPTLVAWYLMLQWIICNVDCIWWCLKLLVLLVGVIGTLLSHPTNIISLPLISNISTTTSNSFNYGWWMVNAIYWAVDDHIQILIFINWVHDGMTILIIHDQNLIC